MKDYLKFNSDKSFVHEITYLTDAEYDLKKNPKRLPVILKTIQNNHWYNPQGKDISNKIKNIQIKNNDFTKYVKIVKDTLENK